MSFFSDFIDDTVGSISDNVGTITGTLFALPTAGLSLAAGAAYDKKNPDSMISKMTGGGKKKKQKGSKLEPIITKAEDLEDFAEDNVVDPQIAIDQAIAVAEAHLARTPRMADTAREIAMTTAPEIDQYLSDRFYSNLENVVDYREQLDVQRDALMSVKQVADELIKGEVPSDVLDFINRTRAERNLGAGLFGEASKNDISRHMLATSYDMAMQGVQLQTQAVSPLSARLLSTAFSLTPPVSDPQALFGQSLAVAAGGSTLQPSAVLQSSAQIGLANAQMAWAGQLSSANMMMDAWQTRMQMDMNRDMVQASQTNAMIGGFSQIAGATIGGLLS